MSDSTTPQREAAFLLAVMAGIAGIGAYLAQVNRVPIIDTCLLGLSSLLYEFIPPLNGLKIAQAPELVTAFVTAILFYLSGCPFTPALARMCGPRLGQMENQMRSRSKKPRVEKIQ
jgi:hypothetical protein